MITSRTWRAFLTPGILGLIGIARCASAQSVQLNFDTDLNGNPISSGTLVSNAYSIPGVTFTADDYIYAGSPGGQESDPNYASGLGDLATFEIDFATPQSYVSSFNTTNSEYTLQVYDSSSNLLGSVVATNDFQYTFLQYPGDISTVTFTATNTAGYGYGYGFDNLSFGTTPITPEPGSLAMFAGMALSGVSFVVRRKRTNR